MNLEIAAKHLDPAPKLAVYRHSHTRRGNLHTATLLCSVCAGTRAVAFVVVVVRVTASVPARASGTDPNYRQVARIVGWEWVARG